MSALDAQNVEALHQKIASLEQVIENQAERIEKQASRIDLLLREKAEDRQRLAELEEYRAENERDKATIRQQVTKAEQATADDESDESETSGSNDETMTPMERLLKLGDSGVMADVTAKVRRAKAIAKHYKQWASKAPNGLIIKDNLKNLLQTATGERLAWNQVYRACRSLVEFTKGAIQFTKHQRFGWILVAEPDAVTNLSRASSAAEG